MKKLKNTFNPPSSIPPNMLPPMREHSRTYGLDSFKKTYAKVHDRRGSGGSGHRSSRPFSGSAKPGQHREFSRLTETLRLEEGEKDEESDEDEEANERETEELMRISTSKKSQIHYPTDAILQRHLYNGGTQSSDIIAILLSNTLSYVEIPHSSRCWGTPFVFIFS